MSVGVTADEFEYSARARAIAKKRLGIVIHPFDLSSSIDLPRCDLSMSLEVVEHLSPELGDRLVDRARRLRTIPERNCSTRVRKRSLQRLPPIATGNDRQAET